MNVTDRTFVQYKMRKLNLRYLGLAALAVFSIIFQFTLSIASDSRAVDNQKQASKEPFEIEAVWIGETQWMSGVDHGYETFGGSIAKGIDFFTSSIKTVEYVPVEIKFESDSSNWSNVQVFRRDLFYEAAGVGTFPGSAWDLSTPSNPRRLNLLIVEFDDEGDTIPPPNFHWDPDTSANGKYEYLFIMNSDYDSTGMIYEENRLVTDSIDVLYTWWPRVASGKTFFETEPASLMIHPIIVSKAVQSFTNVQLDWFTPGPQPQNYGIYWSESSPVDSLIAIIRGSDSIFVHNGISYEQTQYYLIISLDEYGDPIIQSFEIVATILASAPVSAIFPPANAITIETTSQIEVSFLREMDPGSFNDTTFKVFGNWSGLASGNLTFNSNYTKVTFVPDDEFFSGELVTISISRGVVSQSGDSMSNGYSWQFWTRTKPGTLELTEIGRIPLRLDGEDAIYSYSAHAGDFNNDGWSDLVVVCGGSDDLRVFLNDGTGNYDSNFTVFSYTEGGFPLSNIGGDFNNDGNIDLATRASTGTNLKVTLGDGNGGFFAPENYQTGQSVVGLCKLDIDTDGDEDIISSYAGYLGGGSSLHLNNGDGTFLPGSSFYSSATGYAGACGTADMNGDGVIDLILGEFILIGMA